MRILITGGDGFIGSYVQARCKELDIEVIIFDIGTDMTQDITDYNALRGTLDTHPYGGKLDAIIHLAGILGTHELWDTAGDAIDINIKGALNAGRLALEHDAKLVLIDQPHEWFNVYEATKFAARRMLTGLHYDKGLRVDFVTAHNAFGPGQAHGDGHPQKIIPTFATKAWAGEPIPIWGDGEQKCNLVYAGDVADVLVGRALSDECDPLQVWDAGSNELIRVRQVADIVLERTGSEAGVEELPMRRGEQLVPYTEPNPASRPLNVTALYATIDSYRP